MTDTDTKLFIVETIVTVKRQYLISALTAEHAGDEVTMRDSGRAADYFEPVEETFINESIINTREAVPALDNYLQTAPIRKVKYD